MKLLILLLALAALCASAPSWDVCVWDMRKMVQFQANDALTGYYERAGNDFMCAMRSTDKGAGMQSRDTRNPPSAESFFVNDPSNNRFSVNLKAFGWSTDNVMSRAADFANQGWGLALTAPPAVTAEWRFARFVHYDPKDPKPIKDQIYKGKEKFGGLRARSATGASYNIAVNKWMKTILLQGVIPPKVSARKNWGRDVQSDRELPELRFPSDFMWNVWSSRGAVPSINRCGIQQISDCATMKLVARLLLAKGVYDLEWYPATNSQWCTDTQEGRALLATIAGQTCSALLIQHKKSLGIKHITKITVFRGNTFRGQYLPQMLFQR